MYYGPQVQVKQLQNVRPAFYFITRKALYYITFHKSNKTEENEEKKNKTTYNYNLAMDGASDQVVPGTDLYI